MKVVIWYNDQLCKNKFQIAKAVADASFGLRVKGRPSKIVIAPSNRRKMNKKVEILMQLGYKFYEHQEWVKDEIIIPVMSWVEEG